MFGGLALFVAIILSAGCATPAVACESIAQVATTSGDAAPALQDCIDRTPPGGTLALKAGVYRLRQPIRIDRPLTIRTAGTDDRSPGCGRTGTGPCATLLLDPARAVAGGGMPLLAAGNDVRLSHLVIRGVGNASVPRARCANPAERPSGGGIRVSGQGFALRASLIRDFTCYTAVEIVAGAFSPAIVGSVIGPNGDHRPGEIWADGVTIHDSRSAIVRDNLFVDNTDVQLILGGCRDCRIESNRFRHSGGVAGGSFAELMLHSWPNTSGDFTGTIVRGNDIDCGPARRCGFGLMIGAAPWYDGRMTGGSIIGNRVRNALVGLNVDGLTGPVEIRGTSVAVSGGRSRSDCGTREWPSANVAPGSRHLVRGDPSDQVEGSVSTRRCLLNR